MDTHWKAEQSSFLQKQIERQKKNALASGKAIEPRRSKVEFPGPYTRDPAALFSFFEITDYKIFPAPMNKSNYHDGRQPVRYKKVSLTRKVGDHNEKTKFDIALVDWLNGQLQLYRTENDYRNQMAAFNKSYRIPDTKQKAWSNESYLREVIEFLRRGHSLLDPECRCVHTYDEKRAKELGISLPRFRMGDAEDKESFRDGKCTLSRVRKECTSQEISNEICVGDLHSIVDPEGRALFDTLRNNKFISCELSESGEYVWSYKAMLELSNRQNLLEVILNTPCGMKEPSENDAYNGVEGDVKSLKESHEIYAIQNAESRNTLLFPRHKHLEIQVDDDIKKLWEENEPRNQLTQEEQEHQLKQEGLIPTKQEKAQKLTGVKRKATVTRRKSAKKMHQHAHLLLPKS
mmetsp:Transcript_2195/g.6681  ORF Transcript_2195/g.6681 Transcript_2195/m.6681 type:complete len:404 (-) Transcript_2195:194-1405(-)